MQTDDRFILPVTSSRIVAQLHELGIRIRPRQGDDILAVFGGADEPDLLVVFSIEGAVMTVRAFSDEHLGPEQLLAAPGLCNSWNAGYRFPTASVVTHEERELIVSRYHVPVANGLTDLQLRLHLECSLDATLRFWEDFRRKLAEIQDQLEPTVSADDLEAWLEREIA
jgi:Putative bacterial sensory transduction regulator